MAVREADNLRKRRRRRFLKAVAMDATYLPGAQLTPDRIAADRQVREIVEHLVEALPERYRLPLQLHYFHGRSHVEVARILGKPTGTVDHEHAVHRSIDVTLPMAAPLEVELEEQGLLRGVVRDSVTKAAIPGAGVRTGRDHEFVADDDGVYMVTGFAPGQLRLKSRSSSSTGRVGRSPARRSCAPPTGVTGVSGWVAWTKRTSKAAPSSVV